MNEMMICEAASTERSQEILRKKLIPAFLGAGLFLFAFLFFSPMKAEAAGTVRYYDDQGNFIWSTWCDSNSYTVPTYAPRSGEPSDANLQRFCQAVFPPYNRVDNDKIFLHYYVNGNPGVGTLPGATISCSGDISLTMVTWSVVPNVSVAVSPTLNAWHNNQSRTVTMHITCQDGINKVLLCKNTNHDFSDSKTTVFRNIPVIVKEGDNIYGMTTDNDGYLYWSYQSNERMLPTGCVEDIYCSRDITLIFSDPAPNETVYSQYYCWAWGWSRGAFERYCTYTYHPGTASNGREWDLPCTIGCAKDDLNDAAVPSTSISASVPVAKWTNQNVTINMTASDWIFSSGLAGVWLERSSDFMSARNNTYSRVWEKNDYNGWHPSGVKISPASASYTETREGLWYFRMQAMDMVWNVSSAKNLGGWILIDKSAPATSLSVNNSSASAWTNKTPTVTASATDILSGTKSVWIRNIASNTHVASNNGVSDGTTYTQSAISTSYTLNNTDEGIRIWAVGAVDGTDHGNYSNEAVEQKYTYYDCTAPKLTPATPVSVDNQVTNSSRVGGKTAIYCPDDQIDYTVTDELGAYANAKSCLKSVYLYKVSLDASGRAHYTAVSGYPVNCAVNDNNSSVHVTYDMSTDDPDEVEYYDLVATDYAGNTSEIVLVSQAWVLSQMHTSIDRSTYDAMIEENKKRGS